MQPRDEAPDRLRVEILQSGLVLELEQDIDGARIVRKRMYGEPALMVERLEPGLAQVGIGHIARAARAPAASSPMRRR